jgi:hypothetical protein
VSRLSRQKYRPDPVPPMKKAADVPVLKDDAQQQAIPSAWRPALTQVVAAFKNGDFGLKASVPGVEPPSCETAECIRRSIADYGAKLIDLPEASWDSSICMWYGTHWDALVDLWTEEEGRSDLVLHARVVEAPDGFLFRIHMVYVP